MGRGLGRLVGHFPWELSPACRPGAALPAGPAGWDPEQPLVSGAQSCRRSSRCLVTAQGQQALPLGCDGLGVGEHGPGGFAIPQVVLISAQELQAGKPCSLVHFISFVLLAGASRRLSPGIIPAA